MLAAALTCGRLEEAREGESMFSGRRLEMMETPSWRSVVAIKDLGGIDRGGAEFDELGARRSLDAVVMI